MGKGEASSAVGRGSDGTGGGNTLRGKDLLSHLRGLESTVSVVTEAQERAIWERSDNTVRRHKRSGCSDGRPGVFTPCYSRSVKLGILTCGGFRLRNLRLRGGSYQFDKGDRYGAADLAALSRKAPDLPRYAVRAGAAKPLAGPAEMSY